MNNTDRNIQKILNNNEDIKGINDGLEDIIMNNIKKRSDYAVLLAKSKRKARIGIYISMILLAIYAVITYIELLSPLKYNQSNLRAYYPSVFTAIVVIVVYFEMTLSLSVLKKATKSEKL